MARVLLLLSSSKQLKMADGSIMEAGISAPEALAAYEQLVAAGNEVVVASPDGCAPSVELFSLEPAFHYADDDLNFLNALSRGFSTHGQGVRLSLHHVTDLQLIAARRVSLAMQEAGIDRAEALARVSPAGRTAWAEDRRFITVLVETGLAGPLDASQLTSIADELAADGRSAAEQTRERLTSVTQVLMPAVLGGIPDATVDTFSAVVVPGGHGSMADLVDNPHVHRLLGLLHGRNALIACQGPGAAFLLSAPATTGGQWLFDGYRMTSSTDEEESQSPYGAAGLPWSVESALKNAGAVFTSSSAAWAPHVIRDRNLITAQNPRSLPFFLKAVRKALEQ